MGAMGSPGQRLMRSACCLAPGLSLMPRTFGSAGAQAFSWPHVPFCRRYGPVSSWLTFPPPSRPRLAFLIIRTPVAADLLTWPCCCVPQGFHNFTRHNRSIRIFFSSIRDDLALTDRVLLFFTTALTM